MNTLLKPSKDKKEILREIKRFHKPVESFTSRASWKIFKIMGEFISGFEFLASLKKEVTFFGSARILETSKEYKEARQLASKLGKAGFTIITGGGPGIMEAANRGATEAGANSVGLNIQLPSEQRINKYVKRGIGFYYFFIRKVMLSMSARAYIYFPGGFGTLDEFLEIITLIQTKKAPPLPVVLVGKGYWEPLMKFVNDVVYKKFDAIDKNDKNICYLAKDVNDAYRYILKNSKPRKFFTTKD